MRKDTITADGAQVAVITSWQGADYISITDIAKIRSDDPYSIIQNWMRGKDTIEFLGLWEELNNPDFKPIEFEGFKNQAGSNTFTLSPQKWIAATNAKGVISKSGRYGELSRIKTLPLSLPRGFPRVSNFIS
jgi:hypothetical protein